MSKKQGFLNEIGDIYIYQDNGNISDSIGWDIETNTWKINVANAPGAFPHAFTQQISIDPTSYVAITNPVSNANTTFLTTGTGNINLTTAGDNIILNYGVGGAVQDLQFGNGALQSSSTGIITSTAGTNGQTLIGAMGAEPVWANITSPLNTIAITDTANGIELETSGSATPAGSGAFLAILPADANLASYGPPNTFYYGTFGVLQEIIDEDDAFYPGPGQASYTAPATGIYLFNAGICLNKTQQVNSIGKPCIQSNILFIAAPSPTIYLFNINNLLAGPPYHFSNRTANGTVVVALHQGDICYFYVIVTVSDDSTNSFTILGSSIANAYTWVGGYRLA